MQTYTTKWAQDQLIRPPRASTAKENAALFKYGRDQFNYVFSYAIPQSPAVGAPQYDFNVTVDVSSDFWMTQFVYVAIGDTDELPGILDTAIGYVTVTDNTKNYQICKDVWVGAFMQTNTPDPDNYAQRTLWPEPYGIGAGSSFSVSIKGTNIAGPIGGLNCQFYIEGFKNYRLGPNNV